MLTQMYVKDFILIDNMNLDFTTGMSAFTGETGAGKSLLIDAIGILRGDRINASMVKQGKDKAVIEGVFQIQSNHPSRVILEEAGYELEDDTLIISREFNKDGKSLSRMNHRTTTVSLIKEVLSTFIDIHSQHDSQYLLNNKFHLSLLDSYVNETKRYELINVLYKEWKKFAHHLEEALQNDYNEDDLEYLTFQLNEIDEAQLQVGELEELEEAHHKMMAFEKISTRLNNALETLNGEDGADGKIFSACRELEAIHEEEIIVEAHEKLLEYYYAMADQVEILRRHLDQMEFNEEDASQMQERIFAIHKIQRKHGGSIEQVFLKRKELEEKIDVILHRSDYISKQETLVKQAYEAFHKEASELHLIRMEKAKQLEADIVIQLRDLHLENARFQIAFTPIEGNTHGLDQVEFLISMNKGEPLRPLQTTASGGEISRLMLGLKTIFTRLQGIETIIFDEIDTGVSGSVAFAIGKKMQHLSLDAQVFCVTHLAQVAACADHHYLVVKHQDDHTTTTKITELQESQRIEQLALIASDSTSPSAMQAARELFEKASNR